MEYDTADSGSDSGSDSGCAHGIMEKGVDFDAVAKSLGNLDCWEDLLFRNVLFNYDDGFYKGTLDLL